VLPLVIDSLKIISGLSDIIASTKSGLFVLNWMSASSLRPSVVFISFPIIE